MGAGSTAPFTGLMAAGKSPGTTARRAAFIIK